MYDNANVFTPGHKISPTSFLNPSSHATGRFKFRHHTFKAQPFNRRDEEKKQILETLREGDFKFITYFRVLLLGVSLNGC